MSMSIQQDFSAIQRFQQLGDTDWETLKKHYVTTLRLEAGAQEQAAQMMQAHIEDRDIVDYASYREAILRIFPSSYFNLAAGIEGRIAGTATDGYTFTAKWYEFIVTQKTAHVPTGLEKSQKCKIAIKAPGSRKLTSDIDTSILTTFIGENSFFEHAKARIKREGLDYEGHITNAIINGFYSISEELFKMTSASQRDSNAYTDTIAKDKEIYPKFLHDEENNPLIQGERLFSEEEFTKIFKEYKYQKHVQEMAASLFSLHASLEQEEWQVFKDLVKKRLGKILEAELPNEAQGTHISLCQQDYDTIFQGVENIRGHHLKALNAKIQQLSQLDPLPVRAQDIIIAALNRLYVEHLEQCTDCYEQILALKSKRKPLMDELEAKKQALDKELAALKRLGDSSDDPDIQEIIEKKQKNCAMLEESCRKLKDSLRQNIIKTAQLQTEHQFRQILASTFANEAYVCRSAVYHVVNGQSGAADLPISQQTLLGSALQQVGFKLLHSKELTHKNYLPEEIAYYTAKYGQRLFNLIFSGRNAELDDGIIKRLAQGKKGKDLPKFTYLKAKQVRDNAYSTFKRKELALLNDQAKIIQRIKSNPTILDAEKPRKTLELIQQLRALSTEEEKTRYFEQEKELYLSISAKLIGLVCASRLEQKGYLWGQNLLSPLRDADEEEQLEGSVSVISAPAPLQPPEPLETTREGSAIDEHHQIGEDAKSLVMGAEGGKARVSQVNQEARSYSAVVANPSDKTAQVLAEGVFGSHPK
ncbi:MULTISPECIES: hypothetical protein [unclassified Neochlamydia]|uniref:hypothetical protein n=1 Tax=unclassified Neochlamydia TaxID=2643326 RepID=UPI00140A3A3C|nr:MULTISPECIES: hypothetical protein [unclassified Neochlamydia]MBS4166446.1 Uncharacterized protein [Neochlamydia sp. AcF65]NGY95662.1 hypothetical protein [Neochlamydia sp. AcF84]